VVLTTDSRKVEILIDITWVTCMLSDTYKALV
jgi:hypothetical protein